MNCPFSAGNVSNTNGVKCRTDVQMLRPGRAKGMLGTRIQIMRNSHKMHKILSSVQTGLCNEVGGQRAKISDLKIKARNCLLGTV